PARSGSATCWWSAARVRRPASCWRSIWPAAAPSARCPWPRCWNVPGSTFEKPLEGAAMPNIVVVGTQWGDEGKGKVVDVITPHVNVVVRYQGGNNAGHTVVVGREKYVLHSIPSGILHPHCRCVIGCGVVVDPASLIQEMEALVQRGVTLDGSLF